MAEIRRNPCHTSKNCTSKKNHESHLFLKIHWPNADPKKKQFRKPIKNSANKQNKNKYLKVGFVLCAAEQAQFSGKYTFAYAPACTFSLVDGKNFCPFNCTRSHCHKTTLLHNKYNLFVYTAHCSVGVIIF